mgnify:CR=1 FL=1
MAASKKRVAGAMIGAGVMRLEPGRWWRGFGTALFLSLIGLGGTAMAVTIFPLISLLTRDPLRRQQRVLYAIHLSFRLYCAAIRKMGIARIDWVGADKLRQLQGAMIVANHPSLLDVVMIMAATPNVQCIVKAALWRHPFFRLTVGGAGFLRNDLEPEALLSACAQALAEGRNLIVFPEGTRTEPGRNPVLRRGFANLATLTRCRVQVLTITCEPPTLFKGNPWWRVPAKQSHFRLEVGEVIDTVPLLEGQHRSVAARRLVTYLDNFYAEKLSDGHAGKRVEDPDHRGAEAGRHRA